jgi:hypothetical protein
MAKDRLLDSLYKLKGTHPNYRDRVTSTEKDGYRYFVTKPSTMQSVFNALNFSRTDTFDNIKFNQKDLKFITDGELPFVYPSGYPDRLPNVFHPSYFTDEAAIKMIDDTDKSKSAQDRETLMSRTDPKIMLLVQGYLNEILKGAFEGTGKEVWVSGKPDLYSIVVKEPLED